MYTNRILLVDDDPDHLLITGIILRKHGYDVRTLPGCEEYETLLQTVGTFNPELIFMDHDMKGICGADLTRWLKSQPGFSTIPVIYFSGQDNIIQLAEQAGADDHFRKPFKADDLVQITRRYLRQSA